MDLDTFTNYISNLGKQDYNILCEIVLKDVLGLKAFNVDGKNDGGTDFIVLDELDKRNSCAYQVTTQKDNIKNKAYRDAKKAIEKLGVNQFFFLPTCKLNEIETRKLERTISDDLGIRATVYSPKIMAEFVIEYKLVRKFFQLTGVEDGVKQSKDSIDYLEMALHTYTILSSDARNLKSQIYDDTLLYILSNSDFGKSREELIGETKDLLKLSETKAAMLNGRIDALMQKGYVKKVDNGNVVLSPSMAEDIALRKKLYNTEQSTFYSAQMDLLKDFGVKWDVNDSKQSSVWLANAIIYQQISGLASAGAKISNPLFKNTRKYGLDKLRTYLSTKKKIGAVILEDVLKKMVAMASRHPLVVKVVRASVYIALEGAKPLAAAKSLGVNSWEDVNVLVEPTVGIPHICSLQYKGSVNPYFDNAIQAVKRAKELGVRLLIPYNYIKECAGHLLNARKYDGLDLDQDEMQHSKNAFVANYYALKRQNVPMPSSFLDYLATFSPAIKTDHIDFREWVRDITTDIQSILIQSGIEYLEVPRYKDEEIEDIQRLYSRYLSDYYNKPPHLIINDVLALKCTNDHVLKSGEHWILLTYDNSLIKVSTEAFNNVWINNPYVFLDMTELTSDLPENQFCSLVHSLAQYSEHTLSIGARIIDRIVYYASENMQEWQFKQELNDLKKEIIKNSAESKDLNYIDSKIDAFLEKHGIKVSDDDSEADIQNDSIL